MKELNNYELSHINGGEKVSYYRKAGNYIGEFLGVTAAVAIFVADATVDVLKTIL